METEDYVRQSVDDILAILNNPNTQLPFSTYGETTTSAINSFPSSCTPSVIPTPDPTPTTVPTHTPPVIVPDPLSVPEPIPFFSPQLALL